MGGGEERRHIRFAQCRQAETAMDFYKSEEYGPYRGRRIAGAKNEFLLVAGEDMTKTAGVPE
ncbi:MAG: hypothetical protein DMG39_07560 [Acidobacteria bacterium]|nr:MAG: hypothetical protein DMG39_07560 [Acidobacteriota bacterium]